MMRLPGYAIGALWAMTGAVFLLLYSPLVIPIVSSFSRSSRRSHAAPAGVPRIASRDDPRPRSRLDYACGRP